MSELPPKPKDIKEYYKTMFEQYGDPFDENVQSRRPARPAEIKRVLDGDVTEADFLPNDADIREKGDV